MTEDLENVCEMKHRKHRKINKAKVLLVKTTHARAHSSAAKALPVKTTDARERAEFSILSVQKKRIFSMKNVLLCYKSNGQCLACIHPIWDALG